MDNNNNCGLVHSPPTYNYKRVVNQKKEDYGLEMKPVTPSNFDIKYIEVVEDKLIYHDKIKLEKWHVRLNN